MTQPASGADAQVEALRQEIAQTRAELGETVEALAAKADVKARAQEKVDETKARVSAALVKAKDEARVKARAKAGQLTESGRELVHELRTEPAVPARRAVYRVRTSVRDNPKQWAVAVGALLAFAALIIRRRQLRADAQWRGPR